MKTFVIIFSARDKNSPRKSAELIESMFVIVPSYEVISKEMIISKIHEALTVQIAPIIHVEEMGDFMAGVNNGTLDNLGDCFISYINVITEEEITRKETLLFNIKDYFSDLTTEKIEELIPDLINYIDQYRIY